jgi:hypothetical protein
LVGLLSQVMDKVQVVNVVKDNMGVVAVLAMHSVNVDKITEVMDKTSVNVGNVNAVKNIELRFACEVRNNGMYVVNLVKDNMGVVAVLAMHSVNRNIDTKEESDKRDGNVIMNEDNPEQVVEMNIIDKDHGHVDVIDSDSDVILIGINCNFEYNEDVVETVEMQVHKKPEKRDGTRRPCSQSSQPRSTTPVTQSGTTTPAVARYDSVPIITFCVLKLTRQSSGVKLPGIREVMLKTNLKVDNQPYEKPEEKNVGDDIDSDSEADTEYGEDESVEMNIIDEDNGEVDVIDSDSNVIVISIDFGVEYNEDVEETVEMQVHEKPEKRDGARRPCRQSSQPRSTTPATQSGIITPAVARYDDVPIVTLCVAKSMRPRHFRQQSQVAASSSHSTDHSYRSHTLVIKL